MKLGENHAALSRYCVSFRRLNCRKKHVDTTDQGGCNVRTIQSNIHIVQQTTVAQETFKVQCFKLFY
jgi:hypothetical protein